MLHTQAQELYQLQVQHATNDNTHDQEHKLQLQEYIHEIEQYKQQIALLHSDISALTTQYNTLQHTLSQVDTNLASYKEGYNSDPNANRLIVLSLVNTRLASYEQNQNELLHVLTSQNSALEEAERREIEYTTLKQQYESSLMTKQTHIDQARKTERLLLSKLDLLQQQVSEFN